ncbi:hypothetical protein [Halorussus aquaticus]|uniref:Uncharacterized protein n=1 Tax=Halorussus aquaticus TaxID=2953748 RepID=A0ABD5Q8P6_9EURY|nr:hypothetical protein [Halorussus aquaticus]
MPREFISEYGLDPGDYVQQLVDQFRDRCPKFIEQPIEEAIFVNDGPIDYLAWFALDDYEHHTFFYHDDNPNQDVVRRFIFLSPSEQEMPEFKALLQKYYGVYTELEIARLLELRDTYRPQVGERPRLNLGICYNPEDDRVVSGVSGIPRPHEQDIFDDAAKIVPDKNLEKFITRTVQKVHTQVEEKADRHMISADIRTVLEDDPDFSLETTKPLPKGIHPKYTEHEAELWQKPASRVEYIEGSQGFLQIWIPTDEDEITLVNATAGKYDRKAIVDTIRDRFEATVA